MERVCPDHPYKPNRAIAPLSSAALTRLREGSGFPFKRLQVDAGQEGSDGADSVLER